MRLHHHRSVLSIVSVAAIVAGVLTGVTSSSANWNDDEFVAGELGTVNCVPEETGLQSRATGRFLNGNILGVPLDPLVGVSGATVTNNGSTVAYAPASSVASGPDAWAAPIPAAVLASAVTATVGATLPLNWGLGVYNQYGQAHSSGISTGAAGTVSNAGAVDLAAVAGGSAAKVGTLRLSDLTGLGSTLAGLADVNLDIGAVAAVATLDGCEDTWMAGAPGTALSRSYLLTELKARLTSNAVRALMGPGGTVPTTVGLVNTQLNTLIGSSSTTGTAEASLATTLLNGLTGTLTTVLASLSGPLLELTIVPPGTTPVTATVDVDLAPVTALLTGSLSDGAVTVDLGSGLISFDIGALSGGLENRDPNTRLLTAATLNDVVDRVDALLIARLAQIDTALTTVLSAAHIVLKVDLQVQLTLLPGVLAPIPILNVHLGFDGTLAQYIATPNAVVSGPTVSILPGSGFVGTLLNSLLDGVTAGLLNPVLTVLVPSIVTAVTTQLLTPISGTIATVLASTTALRTAAINALDGVLQVLALIVDVTINSRPDVLPNPAPPRPALAGEYFVSALRIGVLNAPGGTSLLSLYLANASVGRNG